jgi:putative isomerase
MKRPSAVLFSIFFSVLTFYLFGCKTKQAVIISPEDNYREIQEKLKTGWGTFNNKNVLSHVLLPEGLALNIGIKTHELGQDNYLSKTLISSRGTSTATVHPGYKSYDGSYSELTLTWNALVFRIESATTDDQDLMLLITPLKIRDSIPSAILETGFLWNRPGEAKLDGNNILLKSGSKSISVRTTGDPVDEYLSITSPYLAVRLDKPVAFYTGKTMSLDQIKDLVAGRRAGQEKIYQKYGVLDSVYQALQSVIGWNIIYDASRDRIIYPVSRIWTETFGGQYVLFDWDTYFSTLMAGMESKELAYANAVEITRAITPSGFIPNFSGSYGSGSFDRSQPPVGSLVFKELYKRYKDKWLLEYVFDDLMTWNRWWRQNRDNNGLLCWGSNPVSLPLKSDFATNTWQGAAYESGLDNSPMFDNVPFNGKTHLMEQADAGLTGLYVMDCDALAEIAGVIGKNEEAAELKDRAEFYRHNLNSLWDKKSGIYRNKRTDTGEFSPILSPTNFYPMLAKAPNQEQAERMVREHLYNPDEFFGEWMIPSIAKNVPAFQSQNYWRGRIWGPMNFLVYLGLKNYDLPSAAKLIADKSEKLMMENVKLNGYVYENYNALTGNVNNPEEAQRMGDCYYHWGALLGFLQLLEAGYWTEGK